MSKIRYIDQSLSEMLLLSVLDIHKFVDLVYKPNEIYYPGDIAYFEDEKKIAICVSKTNLNEGYVSKKWVDYQKTSGNITALDFTGEDLSHSTGIIFDLSTGVRAQILSYVDTPLVNENLLKDIFNQPNTYSTFPTTTGLEGKKYISAISSNNWQDLSLNIDKNTLDKLKPNKEYILKVVITKNTLNGGYLIINDDNENEKTISKTRCKIEASNGIGDFYFKIKTVSNLTTAQKIFNTKLSNRSASGEINFYYELYELNTDTEVDEKFSVSIYADSILEPDGVMKGAAHISGLMYKNENLLDDIVKEQSRIIIYLKNGYKYKVISSALFTVGDVKPLTKNIKIPSGTSYYDFTCNDPKNLENYLPNRISDIIKEKNIDGLLNTLKKDYEKKSTILPKSLLQDLGNFNGIVNPTERIANIQSQASVVENAKNQINTSIANNNDLLTKSKLKLLEKYNQIK